MTDPEPLHGADPKPEDSLFPKTAGERLRMAREAQKLSLADVAARTRVPIRHLEAIETGDYSALPTPTYAIGFAKAYARAVGEDEVGVARDVRGQTAAISRDRQEYQPYEMDDPTRVPPRGVALIAAAIAVIVLIGAVVWLGSGWFQSSDTAPETNIASDQAPVAAAPNPVAVQPTPVGGQITLTALDRVWVAVHDANGQTLFENTMNAGDHFDVPAGAAHPMLSVGRPDKLQVALNGAVLPPLGSGARPIKDMPIDPVALSAHAAAPSPATVTPSAAAVSPTPAPAPSPTASSTPTRPHSAPTPRASHTPQPTPSKTPLKLDLPATQSPAPATTGIY